MKKYFYIATIAAFMLSGCEDFLDTENYTKKNTGNFPETVEDIDMMLNGVYVSLNHIISNSGRNSVESSPFFVSEAASDDRFGGGGSADRTYQMADKLMNYGTDTFEPFWKASYEGIYRTNLMLESTDKITGWEGSDKAQTIGEAHFMRALFYFQLAQMFGEVPMPLSSVAENLPKSSADVIYAQIASDLKTCIETMPDKTYDPTFSGHATKYVAEAYMARVFLFYTGYYGKDSLPLSDGGNILKDQVINWLEDCRDNSGFGLVDDFRGLWPYTNSFTIGDYNYTKGQNNILGGPLQWETDVNKEILFATKCNNYATWSDYGFSNMYNLNYGMRGQQEINTFPFGQGWGCGTVTTGLYEEWVADEPDDPRIKASILDVNDPSEGVTYTWDGNDQMEFTGYFQKKYMNIIAKTADGGLVPYSNLMYNTQNNFQLGQTQDLVMMRYADVLLMHSELTGTSDGMNRVRARVGLTPKEYSLDNLKKERRHELAFEGLRWFDLMRWGDVVSALTKQVGVNIINGGKETVMKEFGGGFAKRYEETGGFWPIPKAQIDLSNGMLTQNAGWGTSESEYPGW